MLAYGQHRKSKVPSLGDGGGYEIRNKSYTRRARARSIDRGGDDTDISNINLLAKIAGR